MPLAGYRAPSLKHTSCCDYFSLSSVVSCAFSVLRVYSKYGHHPHPLSYLFAKFCFFCWLHCWASPWRKIAYSVNHSPSLFDALGTKACASEYIHIYPSYHIYITFVKLYLILRLHQPSLTAIYQTTLHMAYKTVQNSPYSFNKNVSRLIYKDRRNFCHAHLTHTVTVESHPLYTHSMFLG